MDVVTICKKVSRALEFRSIEGTKIKTAKISSEGWADFAKICTHENILLYGNTYVPTCTCMEHQSAQKLITKYNDWWLLFQYTRDFFFTLDVSCYSIFSKESLVKHKACMGFGKISRLPVSIPRFQFCSAKTELWFQTWTPQSSIWWRRPSGWASWGSKSSRRPALSLLAAWRNSMTSSRYVCMYMYIRIYIYMYIYCTHKLYGCDV